MRIVVGDDLPIRPHQGSAQESSRRRHGDNMAGREPEGHRVRGAIALFLVRSCWFRVLPIPAGGKGGAMSRQERKPMNFARLEADRPGPLYLRDGPAQQQMED